MVTNFSLSRSKEKALPETVEVDGSAFRINPDFRNVLKILRMLSDDSITERHKPRLLCEWFYGANYPEDIEAALNAFMLFLHRGKLPDADNKPPVFDYEQDAPEIYSSFLALYGIDLLDVSMHWWRFSALLDGAFRSECALSSKVRMRQADPSKCENAQEVREAQEAIRIEAKESKADRQARERLYEILTSGGDVSAKLEAMKNGL